MPTHLSLVLIGLGIGFLVGLTGVGGGSLMTPILIFMGLPSSTAVGTDLIYSAATRTVGALVHWKQRTVRFDAVRWLATGSIPSTIITTIVIAYLLTSVKSFTQGFITDALAVVLLFVAVSLLFKPQLEARFRNVTVKQQRTLAIAVGVLVGALVALTSVGGGSLTIIALFVLFRTAATSDLIGTDVFHAALLSIAAASVRVGVFAVSGGAAPVNFDWALLLCIGSLPGVIIGSRLTVKMPDGFLRFGLAGTLGFVGLRLIGVLA